MKEMISEKWRDLEESGRIVWVEYSEEGDVKGRVDFEKGEMSFEALVPEGVGNGRERAERKIKEMASSMFSRETSAGHKILKDQLGSRQGDLSISEGMDNREDIEIIPHPKIDPNPILSPDGVKRRRYRAEMHLAPDHVPIRALQYLPIVLKSAQRFRLQPELVMAVIHTESMFNPMAVSPCGALGIMQILPEQAGREAYGFLCGTQWTPDRTYLFDPEKNIELGCAYLHLLKYRYFGDEVEPRKNLYLSLCAYNWGPKALRDKVIEKFPMSEMRHDEILEILKKEAPQETATYLEKVTGRITLYQDFLKTGYFDPDVKQVRMPGADLGSSGELPVVSRTGAKNDERPWTESERW